MEETALFSGKIYTADKNFTRPPVATNFKSEHQPIKETLECSLKMTHFPKPWYYSKGDIRSERASNISNEFKEEKSKDSHFQAKRHESTKHGRFTLMLYKNIKGRQFIHRPRNLNGQTWFLSDINYIVKMYKVFHWHVTTILFCPKKIPNYFTMVECNLYRVLRSQT